MSHHARLFVPICLSCLLTSSSAGSARAQEGGPDFRIGASRGPTLPKVAGSADGSFVVTWIELGVENGIFGQRYDARGRHLAGVFHLPDAAVYQRTGHAVAANGDGDFVVLWTEPDFDVWAQLLDRAGNPRGASFEVSNHSYVGGTTAMNARGDFVVVWDRAYDGIGARRYDRAGNPLGSYFLVDASHDGGAAGTVAMRDDGGFVVAWSARFGEGWTQLYDPAGEIVRNALQVNDGGGVDALDIAADGSFVTVWQPGYGDSPGPIFARVYRSAGTPIGGPFQVNRETDGVPLREGVSLAMGDSGDFFVVWTCCGGDDADVVAQHFDQRGTRIGPPFVVNSHRSGDQSAPSATIAGDGSLVVAWNSSSPDEAFDGLFGRRFTREGSSGDTDADGVPDVTDNCPTVANSDQADAQADGHGDACVAPDVFIPPSVHLGFDPVIGRGTTLQAGVVVGDDAVIGEFARLLRQVEVGDRLRAADYVALGRFSTLGNDVTLGFATRLEASVTVGDRVTIADQVIARRNVVMGTGVRIDALVVVEAGARIGAGATIEMGARIGRGASIAPGAVVPAGTSVPPGAKLP